MSVYDRYFCSAQSRFNCENMCGTAPKVKSWLLVEYPGVWRRDAIQESELPPGVRQRLLEKGRCLLIRQAHDVPPSISCFKVSVTERSSEMWRFSLSRYEEILEASGPVAESVNDPVFLVCTHGNHDKCCSKFGLPIYDLLRQTTGDRAWQCSHVGGDRFAANIVCFPYGIYYGHVDLEDVPQIVDATSRKEIFLKNFRGRACYSKCDQVAEYFVRAQSGLLGLDDLTLVSSGEMTATFRSANGVHSVAFRAKDGLSQILTCKSESAKPIAQYELTQYEFRLGV